MSTQKSDKKSKNIVILCDGTGNEIEKDLSNVLKLYRVLEKNDRQVVFYDPGIGTIGTRNPWQIFSQKFKEVLSLATGMGLDENVLETYRFLIDNYEEGDQVFLFGFSRGAYTVRVLAGFIYLMGLLAPEQKNISDYAFNAYKRSSEKNDLSIAWGFRKVTRAKDMPIKFIGVWDTVSSVLVPRWDFLIGIDQQTLPYTRKNPGVEVMRQAISIDEKRRMFRINRWEEPQVYKPSPFDDKKEKNQDTRQVWFAGNHSDIGGGYPENESSPAKFALKWMILEAKQFGLQYSTSLFNHVVMGKSRKGGKRTYVAPDVSLPKLHDSMTLFWHLMEFIPRRVKFRDWPERKSFLGFYIPLCEPRLIPDGALLHNSVEDRLKSDNCYCPINLPKNYQLVYDAKNTPSAKTGQKNQKGSASSQKGAKI